MNRNAVFCELDLIPKHRMQQDTNSTDNDFQEKANHAGRDWVNEHYLINW